MWFPWTNHRWARMGNIVLCPSVKGCPVLPTSVGHVPGLSGTKGMIMCWDTPGKSHEGHTMTALVHPCIQVWLGVRKIPWGTSQDSPGTSLYASVTWCLEGRPGLSWDILRRFSGHQVTSAHKYVLGPSSDVSLDCSKMSWTLEGNTGHDWSFKVVLPWRAATIMQAALISKWWISTKVTNFNIGDKFSTKKMNFTINRIC